MLPKSLSILLADDDFEDVELLEEALLNIEPTLLIKHVSNGRRAIRFLVNCSDEDLPTLLILDYQMPIMTGLEVLTWLSTENRYKSISKTVLSTSNTAEHIKQCLNNGAKHYLVKPYNMQELESLAKQLLSIGAYN